MSPRPLTERIDAVLAGGTVHLPVYPAVARQVLPLLRQPSPDTAALAGLVAQEPALTCSLFRAANSAFYHGLPKVTTIDEAFTRIGAASAGQLLDGLCCNGEDAPRGRLLPGHLPPLWRHSVGCALGAGWLAERCGYHALAGEAHLAGLLHDVGKLYLLAALEQLAAGGDEELPLGEALVTELLAGLHAPLGRQLVAAWNLPEKFAMSIGRRQEAGPSGRDVIAALVGLADQGCRKLGLGWECDPGVVLSTTAEAQLLGLDEIALAEFEIMLEDRFGLGAPATPRVA